MLRLDRRALWLILLVPVALAAIVVPCRPSPAPAPETRDAPPKGGKVAANRLIHEKSPYLRQHAHNPVDWYPWGEEAFAKARRENKPVFLSIGYSTCHWCHVMERESFEDEEIAALLLRGFVAIKVDREERPDVDQIYMSAVQALTGSGGWPLSVFLTPEGAPFYGGTYFPPVDGYGRPGFKTVLLRIEDLWKTKPEDLLGNAERLTAHLRDVGKTQSADDAPAGDLVVTAARAYSARFDERWGGFGSAPKFPPSMTLELMLRAHRRTGDESLLAMVVTTLDRMADGGMYDHLGGGFHRYSTDRQWLVPHFEKMLYDNALLARIYLDAYLVTGRSRYATVARETLDYVLRDMTHAAGGFYSAEDADSEGEEGTFYVWGLGELREVLDEKEARLIEMVYGVTESGNFEGKSILHLARGRDTLDRLDGDEPEDADAVLARARTELLAVRSKRERPLRDDKILAGWNGLMIGAMAQAHRVLGDERYLAAAVAAGDFLLTHLIVDGRLMRRHRDGETRHMGVLEDHAYVIAGLLDLYETTGAVRWIREARRLEAETERLFADGEAGGYFETGTDGEKLLVRPRDPYDGAIPSGNAITVRNLVRLGALTGDSAYRERAGRALAAFAGDVERVPFAFPAMLSALDLYRDEPYEVVVAGDPEAEGTRALLRSAWRRFSPNLVTAIVPVDTAEREAATKLVPLLEGRGETDGKPTAYVCRQQACLAPVTTARELAAQLEK